jgi:hypothetical protein
MRDRWLPVGVLALVLFAINAAARLVTKLGHIAKADQQMRIGIIATAAVGVVLIAATVRWAMRYPIGRVVADLGAGAGVACLASVLIGPFLVGAKPFAAGLGFFVGQILLFVALAGVGIFLGFLGVVALGKDWKSKGLRQYEQTYRAKPHRPVRS